MKRIQFLSLLWLFVTLPLNITTADMNLTWVRAGVVFEMEHKNGVEGEINITFETSGTAHELAERPAIQRLDANRVLFQFAWQPNQNYQFHLNDSETIATLTAEARALSHPHRRIRWALVVDGKSSSASETHSTCLRTWKYA